LQERSVGTVHHGHWLACMAKNESYFCIFTAREKASWFWTQNQVHSIKSYWNHIKSYSFILSLGILS
jgi:hypothetical protein